VYVYLYDNFLKAKKFDAAVGAVETRLTDFGIAGKIIRLQPFTNTEAVIEEEVKRGATTIVIVGDDATFGQTLSRAASCPVLFGFLPIGPNNSIAKVLGIPDGVAACDVLSRRRKIKLDVGWVSNRNRFFISQLHIPPAEISVSYDERFNVSSKNDRMELVVCNLQPFVWREKGRADYVIHPQDGKLEAFLRPVARQGLFRTVYEEPSIFPFEEMVITGRSPFVVEADGTRTKETKIVIRLAKKRIEMVVGKERKF
jgi:diacylglycerol kinase family enzyme